MRGEANASASQISHSCPFDKSVSLMAFAAELWPSPVLHESTSSFI